MIIERKEIIVVGAMGLKREYRMRITKKKKQKKQSESVEV